MNPDYPLLGLLARRPSSGYDLGKWLRKDGLFLGRKPSMSPIYRALARLEELGWVEARTDPREFAPDARVYYVTPDGWRALEEWAASPFEPSPRPMDPDFMIRFNFAGQLGPEYALKIVETELDYRRKQRAAEREDEVLATDLDPFPQMDPAWLGRIDVLTRSRGWQNTSLYIGWLETTSWSLRAAVEDKRSGDA